RPLPDPESRRDFDVTQQRTPQHNISRDGGRETGYDSHRFGVEAIRDTKLFRHGARAQDGAIESLDVHGSRGLGVNYRRVHHTYRRTSVEQGSKNSAVRVSMGSDEGRDKKAVTFQ